MLAKVEISSKMNTFCWGKQGERRKKLKFVLELVPLPSMNDADKRSFYCKTDKATDTVVFKDLFINLSFIRCQNLRCDLMKGNSRTRRRQRKKFIPHSTDFGPRVFSEISILLFIRLAFVHITVYFEKKRHFYTKISFRFACYACYVQSCIAKQGGAKHKALSLSLTNVKVA